MRKMNVLAKVVSHFFSLIKNLVSNIRVYKDSVIDNKNFFNRKLIEK